MDAEAALVGSSLNETAIAEVAELAVPSKLGAEGCEPISDSLASGWYRRTMAPRIVRRVLESIA
jgi:CO/xanthine dehydrogenase FAD-binding subunit